MHFSANSYKDNNIKKLKNKARQKIKEELIVYAKYVTLIKSKIQNKVYKKLIKKLTKLNKKFNNSTLKKQYKLYLKKESTFSSNKNQNNMFSQMQEMISENITFFKSNNYVYYNPDLIIQSMRNFIKIIVLMKRSVEYMQINSNSIYDSQNQNIIKLPKYILLYTNNLHMQKILSANIKNMNLNSYNNILKYVFVGGLKDLIDTTKLEHNKTLVIFLQKPSLSVLNFCTSRHLYILSVFSNNFVERMRSYGATLEITAYNRVCWMLRFMRIV